MLVAYHGKSEIKAKYLARVEAHAAADEIIHGSYWENGKGCAVGCTIHSGEHAAFETELGIPRMLARLEDTLFEGQKNGDAKTFPARFLAAIQPGADLSRVSWKFLYWILTQDLAGRDNPRVAQQIKACACVLVPLIEGGPADREAAIEARRNARNAAAAAAYAAADARSECYTRMANKLIELLAEAPLAV
jgi:hypothetical protein